MSIHPASSTYISVSMSVTDPDNTVQVLALSKCVNVVVYGDHLSGNVSLGLAPEIALRLGEEIVAAATRALAAQLTEVA